MAGTFFFRVEDQAKDSDSVRVLRLITIVALVLTLPFFGIASVAAARDCLDMSAMPAAHDCCPGEHGAHAQSKAHSAHDQTPHNAPAQSDGCDSCSAAHTCKTSQSLQSLSIPSVAVIPVDRGVARTSFAPPTTHRPDLPLRPPRS